MKASNQKKHYQGQSVVFSKNSLHRILFPAKAIIFSLLLTCISTSPCHSTEFIRGDFNSDQTVTVADTVAILDFLFKGNFSPPCMIAGDTDGDSVIDITDAIFLLIHLTQNTMAPCDPYPHPGEDVLNTGIECESYGETTPTEDNNSSLVLLDTFDNENGSFTLSIRLSSVEAVTSIAGIISIEGDHFANGHSEDLQLENNVGEDPFFSTASVHGEKIHFAYLQSILTPAPPVANGGEERIFTSTVCLGRHTPQGTYSLTLEEAEITLGNGERVIPHFEGGSLTVQTSLTGTTGCEDKNDIEPNPRNCEPDPDPVDPPDPIDPPNPGVKDDFIRGDVNQDGRLSISDALSARRFLFLGDLQPTCLAALDFNGDFRIDISDQISILAAIFLDGPAPGAPFPLEGPDPELNELTCHDYTIEEPKLTEDIIKFGEVEGDPGDEITIPIYITNSREVEAYQFIFDFTPGTFELIEPGGLGIDALDFTDSAIGISRPDFEGSPFFAVVREIEPGRILLGLIPDFITENWVLPPGEDQLLLGIKGRIPLTAQEGTETDLTPTNGPNQKGVGDYKLFNELTYRGEPLWISVRPQLKPGWLKIGPDISIFIRGDANSDKRVDISDVTFLLENFFLGKHVIRCPKAGDVNDDGAHDISDPIMILAAQILGTQQIPHPFPRQGRDLTPDNLGQCSIFSAER